MAKKSTRTRATRRAPAKRTPRVERLEPPLEASADEPIVDTFDLDALTGVVSEPAIEDQPDGREKKERRRKAAGEDLLAIPAEASGESGTGPQAPDESESIMEGVDTEEVPDEGLRQQFMHELDEMIGRLRSLHPGYNPPPFSPRALMTLLSENLDRLPPGMGLQILDKLRSTIGTDLFELDTWKGIWYVVNSTLQYQGDMVKRRVTGEYETDMWGMDPEFRDAVRPFFEFMYKTYWRVQITGMENVPVEGRGLLVANHSGQLPWDGSMIATAVLLEHPNNRIVRPMIASWLPTLPFFSDFLVKAGGVLATEENTERLLEQDELVLVFPEGYKGVGKLYRERYRLQRFGRGGFVEMALKTRAPMVPIAVVGAEETYISLHKSNLMARLTGFPYFPISPTFPWLGLLGFVPLPTKWYIDFGTPIATDGYKEGSENNPVLVTQLTDQIRNIVQEMIFARLAQRRSVF